MSLALASISVVGVATTGPSSLGWNFSSLYVTRYVIVDRSMSCTKLDSTKISVGGKEGVWSAVVSVKLCN